MSETDQDSPADIVQKIIVDVPREFHGSGSLSHAVLQRIVALHESTGVKVSVESGCGLTTLVLSHLSASHTSFTVDAGDSLQNTRDHELFNRSGTEFVIGPTQVTLPQHQFTQPIDFALIDGPHAYPFPDLEYFYFYPHLRTGGLLVIDDIHIPTITNMYNVLNDDDMWLHLGDVETTAFFERTDAPTLYPHGDGWPQQKYNRRGFPYRQDLEPLFGPGWYDKEFGS